VGDRRAFSKRITTRGIFLGGTEKRGLGAVTTSSKTGKERRQKREEPQRRDKRAAMRRASSSEFRQGNHRGG